MIFYPMMNAMQKNENPNDDDLLFEHEWSDLSDKHERTNAASLDMF